MYAFMGLQDKPMCFYIAESKSFAGKDTPGEGEAIGRFVTGAWFECDRPIYGGVIVQPVNTDVQHLQLDNFTLAELLKAAGHFELAGPADTARVIELKCEEKFLDFSLVVFRSARRLPTSSVGDSNWFFQLDDPVDVETHFFDKVEAKLLTKLQLARLLILSGRAEPEAWRRFTMLSKDELAARCLAAPD